MRFLGNQKVTRYWSFEGIKILLLAIGSRVTSLLNFWKLLMQRASGVSSSFATGIPMLEIHLCPRLLMVERVAWYRRIKNDSADRGIHDMQNHDRGSNNNRMTLSIRITRDGICTFCPLEQLEFSSIHIGCVAHAALYSYNQPTL